MTIDAPITTRPTAGDRDLCRMYDLAAAAPDGALHVADLPWRLSSPSAHVPERICLWENAAGELLAWAVLQFPWFCLDYATRLDARSTSLEAAVLDWASKRLETEAANRDESLPFYVSARERDVARIAAIEQAGFIHGGWSYVHLVRDLDQPVPESTPPNGFIVRPLAGEHEVESYVSAHRAAFGSTTMTADWRRATLRTPWYVPELDLVVVGPDGTLAGFCVVWMPPPLPAFDGRRVAQIEPLGVLPRYQRQGLGRALLLESLRRANEHGADWIEVDAVSSNDSSRRAYESVGFRPAFEAPFFLRTFG